MRNKIINIFITSLFSLLLSFNANAASLSLPKVGGSGGGNTDELKLKFTKIFFESSLEYMEAQAHLFDALEMNDEASKTRKSIEFVKNDKNKEEKVNKCF